ncbi:MAG: YlxR family protein [Cyanobacteria bacterium K_DeepCast_35m_m1_288]|nr:YlxR family protein [Cyanobacteria bacterium K_DeepCast_35m_m1_288]
MSERSVLRRCVTCRELLDRRQLWRVIRLADGGIALDQGMGRSAYLCPRRDCLEEARRRKKLQKGLRCQVADSIYAALEQRLHATSSAGSEAR